MVGGVVYRVVVVAGQWQLRRNQTLLCRYSNKHEAVAEAERLARTNPHHRVVIHDEHDHTNSGRRI